MKDAPLGIVTFICLSWIFKDDADMLKLLFITASLILCILLCTNAIIKAIKNIGKPSDWEEF